MELVVLETRVVEYPGLLLRIDDVTMSAVSCQIGHSCVLRYVMRKKLLRHTSVPSRWPPNRFHPSHFDEVEDFLTSDPVTTDELRRMAIASGGAQVARLRGINRK